MTDAHLLQFTAANIECSICLCNIEDGVRILQCNHAFHGNCIERWFRENHPLRTCPNCRAVEHGPTQRIDLTLNEVIKLVA